MKTLITYFSAQGTTAKVAKAHATMIDADLFEIRPEKPYTEADLKWTNPLARCNREMLGRKDVPVEGRIAAFDQYDIILIGFPIWYGAAPNVVNTFCKSYQWNGKRVFAFATSGGSGIGRAAEKLATHVKGAASVDAKLVHSAEKVKEWVGL